MFFIVYIEDVYIRIYGPCVCTTYIVYHSNRVPMAISATILPFIRFKYMCTRLYLLLYNIVLLPIHHSKCLARSADTKMHEC